MINKRMIQLLKLSLSISMLHSIFCPLPIFAQEEEPIEQQEESQEDNTIEEINILDVQLLQSEENTSIQVLLDQEVDIQQIALLVQGNNTLYTINHPNQEGCYYSFTIELDSGEYRAEYLKIGETTLFFEEPLSFTIEQEEEIEVQNSYYGQYDGFDYTGQTTDPDRLKVLQKGKDIISFCWTAPFDMPTWKDEYGDPSMCTDINGYTSWQFEAGHTYSGLPYTLNATGRQYDDIKWKKLLDSGNYTYSTFSGKYSFSGGITVSNTSIKGTDCSAFVSTCLNEVAPTPFYFSTYRMLRDSTFVKVTGLTREERFKNLQPADVLVNDSHAMLYVGRDEDGYMYFYESLYPISSVICTAYPEEYLIDAYEAYRYYKLCDIKPAQEDTTLADYLPIKTYGNSSSINIYDKYGTKKTTITTSTLFTIEEIYDNGRCKIKYGTNEGYANTSDFLPEYSISEEVAPIAYTTYRNSYNTTTLGSIAANTKYLKVGNSTDRDCILYETSSGNYLGWIFPLSKQEKLQGYSLSVSGDLCLYYYFDLGNAFTTNPDTTLVFKVGKSEQRIKLSEATKPGNYYIFPCRLSAKDMTTTITAQFDLGNGVLGKKYTYSIEKYANSIISNPSLYSAKDVNVAKSMITYGYYTQKYFDYRTDKLPGNINTINHTDLSSYHYLLSDTNNDVQFAGARLVLGSRVGIKLYFTDKGNASFKVNGTNIQAKTEGKYKVITLSGILSFDKMYTITTTDFSLQYCVLSYAHTLSTSNKTDLYNLLQAMYDFFQYYK